MTTDASLVAGSFRDPSGFVFRHNGFLYRQVNRCYASDYDLLMSSGLYQELVEADLLVSHEECAAPAPVPATAYKVIRPEPVWFISYPYEWSFSQLKDAALAQLRIQRRALRHGMTLKDASAYNVQFHHGKPVFIDTLSFTRYQEGRPWAAYRQFCQHFLAPLALMSYCDIRLWAIVARSPRRRPAGPGRPPAAPAYLAGSATALAYSPARGESASLQDAIAKARRCQRQV